MGRAALALGTADCDPRVLDGSTPGMFSKIEERLRATMAAVRIAFTWFGVRKSLNTEQKAQAADTFGAEGSFLSAGKKLIDTSDAAFKAVTSVKSSIQQYWRAMTVPYPEPGIRLIRRDEI